MSYFCDENGLPLEDQGETGLIGDEVVIADLRRQLVDVKHELESSLEKIKMAEQSGVCFSEYGGQSGPVLTVSVPIDPDVSSMIDEAIESRSHIKELGRQLAESQTKLEAAERDQQEAVRRAWQQAEKAVASVPICNKGSSGVMFASDRHVQGGRMNAFDCRQKIAKAYNDGKQEASERIVALEADRDRLSAQVERMWKADESVRRLLGGLAGYLGLQISLGAKERFAEINRWFDRHPFVAALSDAPDPRREAEQRVIEAAKKWYDGPIVPGQTELGKAVEDLARLEARDAAID